MWSMLILTAVASAAPLAGPATVPQTDRFTVYLSAPMRDGFADTSKDIQDSIKDISTRINGMKEIQTVDRKEIADIVLTVVTRGVGSQSFGERTNYAQYYHNAVLTTTPIVANTWWVSTMMDVGTYRKEFIGAYTNQSSTSMGAWTECAKQIAKDLQSWATANADRLRQLRIHK